MWVRAIALALAGIIAGCSSSHTPGEPDPPPGATAPTITTQPASMSVVAGQTASFTVAASGTAPFTYQWRRNGVDIAGATSATYTSAATTMADDAVSFTAIVTNSAGTATSTGAVLTITAPSGTTSSIHLDQTTRLLTTIGETFLLVAGPVDAAGAPVAGAVTWQSTNPTAIPVDNTGRITAQAIGSAMIFATANGIRSQPIFVMVAEPAPGALIVSDAQVMAIGEPIDTHYEVTVSGLTTAPAAGTVVLASGDQPVAGKVVSSRAEAGNLILLLDLTSLPELLARYDIDWNVDLSTIPVAPIEIHEGATVVGKNGKIQSAASGRAPVIQKFEPFSCDGEIAVSLLKTDISLTPQISASLILKTSKDDPSLTKGYGKLALMGSQALSGTVGITLNAGFNAKASCVAQGLIKIPVGGVVSILVMPALRIGAGFEVGGQFVVASGELKATGKIGAEETLGFECNPLAGGCQALSDVTMIDDFKFVKTIPTLHDMHVELAGQIFAVVGIDAVFGLVLADAEIVEARVGPKQTFDLAFPNDQAENRGTASNYHLDLDGVIQPGPSLAKAIKKYVGDENVSLNFTAPYSTPLASSPKGTLTLSESDVAYGSPVEFQVHLDNPLTYPLLGENGETAYNVDSVQIWRKKQGEAEFTSWTTLTAASGQSTFQIAWTPESSDVGDYEFAAFVDTLMPVPVLEIAANTVKPLHVRGPGWSGTITYTETGTQVFTGSPISGATQVTTKTVNGSGEFRLETVPDELGVPKLIVSHGTGIKSTYSMTTFDRVYTFDDCTITQAQTSEWVEQGEMSLVPGSGVSLTILPDDSYQLILGSLSGFAPATNHIQATETSTGGPHCVPTPPIDTTNTISVQIDMGSIVINAPRGDDPNVLAGTTTMMGQSGPTTVRTIHYDLRRN